MITAGPADGHDRTGEGKEKKKRRRRRQGIRQPRRREYVRTKNKSEN